MNANVIVYGFVAESDAVLFRRNRKIANCNEFRLGIQPQ